ncbi:TAF-domain-containing protein [Acaromyces ingoldii]|uniref:TAF-domain-containing protein n=1 Tax=Acaromyces ingoldii TaxID=215250 RepID=A0A316YI43_9BASI|nr:TAF-domain-containing protein [Acaromyces ingoldii]PWN87385.1 TAF-domain-containing protein [Acaromyces ingoldii]
MPPRSEASGSSSRSNGYSIYPTDSVQDVADSLGLPPLKDSVAQALAADVEYRVRQVVQDAGKLMRHAKRSQIRTADIDRALRARNIEPIFGFHPTTQGHSTPQAGYPSPVGSSFRRIQTPSAGPLHILADEEIDLDKVLQSGPKISVRPAVGWAAHWLAIEGVQPAIPQNPNFKALGIDRNAALGTAATTNNGPTAANGRASTLPPGGASAVLATGPNQAMAKPLIKHVLSRELQLYFERLTEAILAPPKEADVDPHTSTSTSRGEGGEEGDVTMANGEDEEEKRNERGEQDEQTSGNTVRDAALASLRGDPGLHQLVPYLMQWVGERVASGLRDEEMLSLMLVTINAIVSNPYLGIEPYLNQLLPSVLSILLTSTLGGSSAATTVHRLRTQAGHLLAFIIETFTLSYPTLRPRVARTLLEALDAGTHAHNGRKSRSPGKKPDTAESGHGDEGADEGDGEDDEDEEGGAREKRGPQASMGTKLGAVIGLAKMGKGTVRALLVNDELGGDGEEDSNMLKRLGDWLSHRVKDAGDAKEEDDEIIEVIVEEVRRALYTLGPALAPPSQDPEAEREQVETKAGAFWNQRLGEDVRVRKAILAGLQSSAVVKAEET